MKKIDLVVATRNRLNKLKRMIESVPDLDYLRINIISDADKITTKYYLNDGLIESERFKLFHMSNQSGAVICRNYVFSKCEDGVLYATDDMTFDDGSIQVALKTFNGVFNDDDGVVGFVQIPKQFHPTGVALVGKKFLDRYPRKQLFNPGYFHFACQEIHWLAKKLGLFYQEKEAGIHHAHPAFFKDQMDRTHQEARIHRKRDHDLIAERQRKGLIWGM